MKITVKLFLLTVLLAVDSFAIDFTTIGQKEIVDYIKNRPDIIYGAKLNERNLQDLLSNVVFTGLEEEAATFAYGQSASSEPKKSLDIDPQNLLTGLTALVADSTPESVPLKIFLTSDSQATTDIQTGTITTTESSSSKQSVGDFVVTTKQSENSDTTNLDGSLTVNLGGSTYSHNLTLLKTVFISAEIKITSLGSEWDPNLLKNDRKLISLLPSTPASLYTVEYQSLIRETIPSNDGDLFGGVKTSGIVLVHKNSDGVLSLAGRLISGKIEPTLADAAEEIVDTFLSLNGAKSRQFFIKDNGMIAKSSNPILVPNKKQSTLSKSNYVSGGSGLFDYLGYWYRPGQSYHENRNQRAQSRQGHNWNHDSRSWHEKSRKNPWKSWYPSSDRYEWQSNFGFRYEWNWKRSERNNKQYEWKEPSAQVKTTTPKPKPKLIVPTTVKQSPSPVTPSPTPSPSPLVTTRQPEMTTQTPVKHDEMTTANPSPSPLATTRQPEKVTTSKVEPSPIEMTTESPELEITTEKTALPELTEPELPPLPKGTTVSVWSTSIIQ